MTRRNLPKPSFHSPIATHPKVLFSFFIEAVFCLDPPLFHMEEAAAAAPGKLVKMADVEMGSSARP